MIPCHFCPCLWTWCIYRAYIDSYNWITRENYTYGYTSYTIMELDTWHTWYIWYIILIYDVWYACIIIDIYDIVRTLFLGTWWYDIDMDYCDIIHASKPDIVHDSCSWYQICARLYLDIPWCINRSWVSCIIVVGNRETTW